MHRYDELEKLYYKKKINSILLNFFILFLIVILFYFFYNLFFAKKGEQNIIKHTKEPKKAVQSNTYTNEFNITKKVKKRVIKKKKKTTDNTPVLSFIIPDINITVKTKNTNLEKKVQQKNKNVKENNKTISNKTVIPVIKEERLNINKMIKNFNVNPTYDTAISISNYYLNKNKLFNAKLWALKANSIDPKRYESWKIFALILLNKHKNKNAKEVLQTYLNDYGYSSEINKLLRSINE